MLLENKETDLHQYDDGGQNDENTNNRWFSSAFFKSGFNDFETSFTGIGISKALIRSFLNSLRFSLNVGESIVVRLQMWYVIGVTLVSNMIMRR